MQRTLTLLFSAIPIALLLSGNTEAGADEPAKPEKAFALFVDDWMEVLSQDAERERSRASLLGPEATPTQAFIYRAAAKKGLAIRTQATGKEAAPYVGILTYTEEIWECAAGDQESCKVVDSSPVTEIFPYTEGSWRH